MKIFRAEISFLVVGPNVDAPCILVCDSPGLVLIFLSLFAFLRVGFETVSGSFFLTAALVVSKKVDLFTEVKDNMLARL